MKARKKPVIIECFQWDGDFKTQDGLYYVPEWAVKAEYKGVLFFQGQGDLYVKTLEGDMLANIGDYIIRGVNGELYPCKPDVFGKTYELLD